MASIVIGTAGHIDHGKSTLVHALTGIDPDRLKEEKARGITIELGFAHAAIGGTRVAFVDVPGHEKFVRTMLAGVGGIDAVLLIVAADESVMPQTREHFDICRLLQVRQGIVVVTKIDLADADMRALVRMDVAELVRGSFLEPAPVIEISARTGEGLDALRDAIVASAPRAGQRSEDGAARLPIDRVFTMRGFGTVVTGTLVGGAIAVDDELALEPGGRVVKVRGLQVHGEKQARASAGQRTAINLGGVEVSDVARGQTLATPDSLAVTRRADAIFDLLPSTRPLRHGARVRMHNGTAEVLGRVSLAGADLTEVKPGQRALVRLRLESPAALTRGDRFILRAYSPLATIGGGRVLDAAPARPGVRSAQALAHFERLAIGEPGTGNRAPGTGARELAAHAEMVEEAGAAGLVAAALVPRAGVAPGALPSAVKALVGAGLALAAGDRLVAPAVVNRLSQALVELVTAFHRAQPLSDGIPREEAREKIFAAADPAVFELVMSTLGEQRTVVGRDRLALGTHRVALSDADAESRSAIERVYKEGGLTPPDAATVARTSGLGMADVDKLTALLLRRKTLQRVDTLIFHSDALAALKKEIAGLKAGSPGGRATVDVAMFIERYGMSRKFAIPLLEFLDRERVTRRVGDSRIVL
jgi:selenocysteine-specific elongation factor